MANKINFDLNISDFVSQYPQSKKVFKKFGLDYSDMGEKNISSVAQEKNISQEDLIASLEKSIAKKSGKQKSDEWQNMTLTEITDYVEKKHHAFLWTKLPSTDMLLEKIIQIHGEKHGEFLLGIKRIFAELKELLENHLTVEEETLFELVRKYEALPKSKRVLHEYVNLDVMMVPIYKEHDVTKEILSEMRCFTSEYETPSYACDEFIQLYDDLRALENDLHEHIYIENAILMPRIKEVLK